jgi:hypothetical protein
LVLFGRCIYGGFSAYYECGFMSSISALNLISIVLHLVMIALTLFVDDSFYAEGYTAYVMAIYAFSIYIAGIMENKNKGAYR